MYCEICPHYVRDIKSSQDYSTRDYISQAYTSQFTFMCDHICTQYNSMCDQCKPNVCNYITNTCDVTNNHSIFRYINTFFWSKCNKALSSGPLTTTWIWNLHDHAHDFDIQQSSTSLITRKVFSSNLAHLSLVFFWISGMHFHGAYFANYSIWLKDGKHYLPSSHLAYSLIGQDILNDHNSNQYSYAIRITSGLFQLWRSEGIITQIHLKYAAHASLIGTIICHSGSYFHMHMLSTSLFYKKFNSLSIHHLMLILGLSCISCAAHQIHISLPANPLLDSSTGNPLLVIPLSDLCVNADLIEIILPGFRIGPLVNYLWSQ